MKKMTSAPTTTKKATKRENTPKAATAKTISVNTKSSAVKKLSFVFLLISVVVIAIAIIAIRGNNRTNSMISEASELWFSKYYDIEDEVTGYVCYQKGTTWVCDNFNPVEVGEGKIGKNPDWVKEGLNELQAGSTSEQALFTAQYLQHATDNYRAPAVLGQAYFENSEKYTEEELTKIKGSLILYLAGRLA